LLTGLSCVNKDAAGRAERDQQRDDPPSVH
jgi:hypothetical protein